MEWQPISTAPKEPDQFGSTPILLLANMRGPRALGYWGKGIRNTTPDWISLHDHRPIPYASGFTHWMLCPDCPRAK
jgi:hypothetical protein